MSQNSQKDIEEVVNAANEALFYLVSAEEKIISAKKWGIADMLGGKIIISTIKNDKIQQARNDLYHAQNAINILSEELLDLNQPFELTLEVGNGLMALDILFDNFFVDLITHQKLKQAQQEVENLIAQVEAILDAISAMPELHGEV